MKIVFNTNYQNAGTMVCVDDLSRRFMEDGHDVSFGDWKEYGKYDVAFFMALDSDVERAKSENPNILCGIMDPKLVTRRQRREASKADFLGVSSIEQRDIFLQYNSNIFIYYMFPSIKENTREHAKKEKVVIGYHGNKLHLQCIGHLASALDALSEKYDIEFAAMYNIETLGKWKIGLPRKCHVRHVQWSRESYDDFVRSCDIGVVPASIPINGAIGRITSRLLSSFIYNWPGYYHKDYLLRFKYSTNPGRLYVFSRFGIPVVADFLPSHCQFIQDGQSGFLVYSQNGWYTALETLILSHDLRSTMGANLNCFISENYSPETTFRKFLDFLNSRIVKKI